MTAISWRGYLCVSTSAKVRRLLIFDFDDTLFDTYGFYADVLVRLNRLHGLDIDQFSSEGLQHLGPNGSYDFYAHLCRYLQISVAHLNEQLIGQLPRESYVFADGQRALKRLRANDTDLLILTVGHRAWQNTKFRHAPEVKGIKKSVILIDKGEYLQTTQITSGGGIKLSAGARVMYQSVTLIDDNVISFKGLESGSSPVRLVRIKRPGAKHSTAQSPPGVTEVTSLDELT